MAGSISRNDTKLQSNQLKNRKTITVACSHQGYSGLWGRRGETCFVSLVQYKLESFIQLVVGVSWCLQQTTNPVFIIDDLDDAAMLVFHWGRGYWLFWLHWLGCFLLELLLRDNSNTYYLDLEQVEKTYRNYIRHLISFIHQRSLYVLSVHVPISTGTWFGGKHRSI